MSKKAFWTNTGRFVVNKGKEKHLPSNDECGISSERDFRHARPWACCKPGGVALGSA